MNITPQFLAEQRLSLDFTERFWKKVNKTESCWLWTANIGGVRGTGYGQIVRGDCMGKIGAHVASWILHNGPIENGLCVLHNCPNGDNRACCNPAHLFLGTKGDNNRDTVKKGRNRTNYDSNKNLKLTIENVSKIKHLLIQGHLTGRQIAARFGVSSPVISMIKSGQRWGFVAPIKLE